MFNPQLDELEWREVYVGKVTSASVFSKITWSKTNLIDIKAGDIFKMIDPDNSTVLHENGRTEFVAKTDGYINFLGIPEVEIYI